MWCHGVFGLVEEMHDYTDIQLAALVSSGNSDAFVELTARYMSLIRAKAAPFHSNMLEADDLFQEGLLGLLNAAKTYKPDSKASFRTYAGVCINNRIIMAYRWAVSRKNLPLNDFVPLSEEQGPSEEQNPEEILAGREGLKIVKQHIKETLSTMEYQVLLSYLGGCSYQEIAQKLRITPKAADNALQRVRRKLVNMPG